MRLTKTVRVLLAVWLAHLSSLSVSAEISSKLNDKNHITIDGTFSTGDSIKFQQLIELTTSNPIIEINSPGGSLAEAVKIGEIVWRVRASTTVPAGSICASACFLTWINGANRHALNAKIGLHRPYFQNIQNSQDSIKEQVRTIDQVNQYLISKLVPRNILEKMMARASNEIYWLNEDEIYELSGTREDLKDLFIAHCGAYSDQILRIVTTPEKMAEWRKVRACEYQLNEDTWQAEHKRTQ